VNEKLLQLIERLGHTGGSAGGDGGVRSLLRGAEIPRCNRAGPAMHESAQNVLDQPNQAEPEIALPASIPGASTTGPRFFRGPVVSWGRVGGRWGRSAVPQYGERACAWSSRSFREGGTRSSSVTGTAPSRLPLTIRKRRTVFGTRSSVSAARNAIVGGVKTAGASPGSS